VVGAASVVGTAAGLGLMAVVEVIRAAATATAARVAAGAMADIKAAEIPKTTGALAEMTLAMVIPAVMIPEMVISRKLMMLVVMVESSVMDALMAGRPPARSNATVRLPSFGRRRWARAVNRRARNSSPRPLATSSSRPSATPRG
jgi:hypothetical protein